MSSRSEQTTLSVMDTGSFPPTPESFDVQEKVLGLSTSTVNWETVAERRRYEIQSKIPHEYLVPQEGLEKSGVNAYKTCGLLTPREQEIVEKSAKALLELIHNRYYSSVEVTRAFCKSSALAHQLTNCVAWIMFEESLAQAAILDEYIETHGKPIGPLHGLPISVKEHVFLKHTPSTSAFIAWADDIASEDSLMVKIFREAGAVFHVKTTNPQSLMALETESNLYGTTKNPYNTALTSGGSSGGESALIAMKGSPLGIGTDIGGSIRVPSAFCGIYGLKPSVGRLPHGGLSGAHGGMENIIGAVGPMARTVEDMALFCKIALQAEPWLEEPPLVEIPWKAAQESPARLRVGVMFHDEIVNPHPPVVRTLNEAVAALQKAGHEIVKWDPSLHRDLINTIDKLYFLDGGKEYHDILEAGNEPPAPLTKWILEKPCCQIATSAQSWKINQRRNALQIAYASQWNAAKIDVLLCPANASVASAHTESTYWGYSSAFNILDYSAVTFPVSFVKDSDTWENFPRLEKEAMSEEDSVYEGYFGKGEEGSKKYKGAPVSLQLVGRRFTEEKLLGMLGRVVEDLKSGGVS